MFGVADPKWGEAVTACVVLRPGCVATEAELMDWVRRQRGAYQAPKRIGFAAVLPLTSVGKVDKRALAARASHT